VRACRFFGEQIKGLRRDGVPVDDVPEERWTELFTATGERPVLWEAWQAIVEAIAAAPERAVGDTLEELGLTDDPPSFAAAIDASLAAGGPDHDDGTVPKRQKFHMGRVMPDLRGRVPGREVAAALATKLEEQAG